MSFRFYHIINALSLDVAFGAGVLSLVLGSYMGFRIPVTVLLVLVLTVWVIYTADHLLDAKSIPGQASSFRHHFHQHFFKTIVISFIVVLLTGIFLITQMPPVTIFYGIPVALGVVAYFVLNRFFNLTFQKEILIASLYVIGVFVGPYSLSAGIIPVELTLLLVELGLMAWINLLIFGLFEMDEDKQDGLRSTAIILGEEKTGKMIKVLLFTCFAIGMVTLVFYYDNPSFVKLQIVFLMMMGILGTLFFRKESIVQDGLNYRYFGDGIFFMPVAYFWF